MKTLLSLIAAALLTACSGMPSDSPSGSVKHPDPFHSYID